MNILTEAELLTRFNALPGVHLERRAFGRSIRPLMADPRRGEARQISAGRTQPWVYDARDLWQWDWYLTTRAELIRRGVWSAKRPYSITDLEDIALLNAHADLVDSLFSGGANDSP